MYTTHTYVYICMHICICVFATLFNYGHALCIYVHHICSCTCGCIRTLKNSVKNQCSKSEYLFHKKKKDPHSSVRARNTFAALWTVSLFFRAGPPGSMGTWNHFPSASLNRARWSLFQTYYPPHALLTPCGYLSSVFCVWPERKWCI